ncbi:pirin family protein [Maribacter sp. 2-571]|uniref:pirin family protein n=1 Tax=Maribacter sp. 2-571 TaxID=3417569 RepID=UPI003D351325
MKTTLYKAESRGHGNHGWLKSYHSFSFANYYDPKRMGFGVLRVLNDDEVAPGMGFGTHGHSNMEIISIPLEGDLEHKDDMGNTTVIRSGDIQVMSAGTGVKHSEYNHSKDNTVKFLQIWIVPKKANVEPRYDQISLDEEDLRNQLCQIVSPSSDDDGVWIHQDAWFHLGYFDKSTRLEYVLKKKSNGVYVFLLEGTCSINNEKLGKRDALSLVDVTTFSLDMEANSRILLLEVPMSN